MLRLVGRVVLQRLLAAVPIMIVVSIVVFVVLRLLPAAPIGMMLPPGATAADAEALRKSFGFDRPLVEQYWMWLAKAAQGDLGSSISFREPVASLIGKTLPATLELALAALVIALALALPAGLALYALRDRPAGAAVDLATLAALSIPSFLWALFLLLGFGVKWPLLPFTGRIDANILPPNITGFLFIDLPLAGRWRDVGSALAHIVLPATALALGLAPIVARVLRASLIEAAAEDYVYVARLRGLTERRILVHHMLRNAALPTVTLIGVQFGFLFGGTLLVELIFSYPGIGNLMVQAVRNHDMPLLQGVALVFCVVVLLTNTIVDALYVVLNPRLRK